MEKCDNFADGSRQIRSALADVTNRPEKRTFSLISGDPKIKSGDGFGKNVDGDDGDSEFTKQVCFGVESLVKEKCKKKFGIDFDKVFSLQKSKQSSDPSSVYQVDSSSDNVSSDHSNAPDGKRDKNDLFNDRIRIFRDSIVNMTQDNGIPGDGCVSNVSKLTNSEASKQNCGSSEKGQCDEDIPQGIPLSEALATLACTNVDKDPSLINLGSSKIMGDESSRLPRSHGLQFSGLERCVELRSQSSANLLSDTGIKKCSCSFCLKAAYMWSDLHFQDIKGRIAALKKSQKETSMLFQKIVGNKHNIIHGQGNCSGSSKLESDLTGQWRLLFLRMEDILAEESREIEARFADLKDLREDCKLDLAMICEGSADMC